MSVEMLLGNENGEIFRFVMDLKGEFGFIILNYE